MGGGPVRGELFDIDLLGLAGPGARQPGLSTEPHTETPLRSFTGNYISCGYSVHQSPLFGEFPVNPFNCIELQSFSEKAKCDYKRFFFS